MDAQKYGYLTVGGTICTCIRFCTQTDMFPLPLFGWGQSREENFSPPHTLVCRKLGYKMYVHVFLPLHLLDLLKQQFQFFISQNLKPYKSRKTFPLFKIQSSLLDYRDVCSSPSSPSLLKDPIETESTKLSLLRYKKVARAYVSASVAKNILPLFLQESSPIFF